MRSPPIAGLLGLLLLLATACGDEAPTAVAPPAEPGPTDAASPGEPPGEPQDEPQDERPDGALLRFRRRMEQVIAACVHGTSKEAAGDVKDLLLPDPEAWFGDTFGSEHVKSLVAEYSLWERRIPQLPFELLRTRKAGKTAVLAERFDSADDPMATTFQAIALRKMKVRTPLYSLRLVEPGEEDGWHVWSFIWLEGKVRFVGRLMALTPIAADADLARRASLRKKVEREIRTGK